jgi:spore maturation protein CgeB
MSQALDILILGLSLRSSWGNGHATTWRALVTAMLRAGHRVRFLERDLPWYARHDDTPAELAPLIELYASLDELRDVHAHAVATADLVMVGSYVPDGIEVGAWVQSHANGVTAFYDIDTPVTLASLARGDCDYLDPRLVPAYELYLSFTGGPMLQSLRRRYGAHALPFYCAVDPSRHAPEADATPEFDLGYMGTYSPDRQPPLDCLLLEPARSWPEGRFIVAGPQYPDTLQWPANVTRVEHVAPGAHRHFYNAQRFTLNVTRADMVSAGWSPSVRLFEAAACGTPIISDVWPGLDELFEPGREILLARQAADVAYWLQRMPEDQRRAVGMAARRRVLAEHTADHRVRALERHFQQAIAQRSRFLPARTPCNDYAA